MNNKKDRKLDSKILLNLKIKGGYKMNDNR